MADKFSRSNGGFGVVGLLGVLFVGLKLMGYIDWSWWIVPLPFYIGVVSELFILAFYGLFLAAKTALRRW